jgi:hypothetical protein
MNHLSRRALQSEAVPGALGASQFTKTTTSSGRNREPFTL